MDRFTMFGGLFVVMAKMLTGRVVVTVTVRSVVSHQISRVFCQFDCFQREGRGSSSSVRS
jgi:hypothetical protein